MIDISTNSTYSGVPNGQLVLAEVPEAELLSNRKAEPIPDTLTVWELHQFKINCLIILVYFACGVIAAHILEGMSPVDSIYVIIQIITTVGYGDLTTQEPACQLFLCFYVFLGLGIVANAFNTIAAKLFEMDQEALRMEIAFLHRMITGSNGATKKSSMLKIKVKSCGFAFLYWSMLMLASTWFYATFETKTWVQSFYMSMITVTTVGFGDVVPDTMGGKLYAILLMGVGVLATGNLVAELSKTFTALWRRREDQEMSPRRLIAAIDTDMPGLISESEFLLIMLLKQRKVKMDEVHAIRNLFRAIDTAGNGTGQLTYEMVEDALDDVRTPQGPTDDASAE